MRITVLRPPVSVLHKFSKPVECLALGYLTSSLRLDDHDVQMIDGMLYGWTTEETVGRIVEFSPDILCITIVLQHFPPTVIEICKLLRASGYQGLIFIGGHAVSFFSERILKYVPEIDGVCCGEGEHAIREAAAFHSEGADWRNASGFCCRLGEHVRRNATRRVENLDTLPLPARDLVREIIQHDGLICVSTSRGCNSKCSFCSVPRFYGLKQGRPYANGNWIARSIPSIVDEIASLHDYFGLLELLIIDDEFFGGTQSGFDRAIEFGHRMESRRIPLRFAMSCRAENVREDVLEVLMRGGLSHVFIGVENNTQDALKLYVKGQGPNDNMRAVNVVKAMGLSFQAGFMLFNYDSTLDHIRENFQHLKTMGEFKPLVINSAVDAHFGSPLTIDMENKGVLRDCGLSLKCDYVRPVVGLAKRAAELCAEAFEPYMNLIAGLQSAITYEWRRNVPGRRPSDAKLLDSFELAVNNGFATVVEEAVDLLHESVLLSHEELTKWVEARLDTLRNRLEVAKAMVVVQISRDGERPRYWSQVDLIDAMKQNKRQAVQDEVADSLTTI